MPKKKQATFQSNVPGKFIPRDDSPSATGFQSGKNTSRFNSKMVELLAASESSSAAAAAAATTTTTTRINNENESISNITKSSHNDLTTINSSETTAIDSSRVHSKLFHRRIVTMLETLRGRGNTATATLEQTPSKVLPSYVESKSQPITFGQLRQATGSSESQQMHKVSVIEESGPSRVLLTRSHMNLTSRNANSDKSSYPTNAKTLINDTRSNIKSVASSVPINKSSSKHQANKERLYYSPSLEQLLEQHNVVPRMKQQDEELKLEDQQLPKPTLTVDEILATYYSKAKVPTNIEVQAQPSVNLNDNMNFFLNPSSLSWNTSQANQLFISSSSIASPLAPPALVLNEQNRNRPPPPSYSYSIANSHRTHQSGTNNPGHHMIRPPAPSLISEQVYAEPQIAQHLISINPPITLPTSLMPSNSIRPPPPRYQLPTSTIERSHSALSSMNRPIYSQINPPQAGFDREFSRLLYGKSRNHKQKRKAFSDPVKKSVEEAGRSIENYHRRLATQVNKNDTVNEEEESSNDSTDMDKKQQNFIPQRRIHRHAQYIVNNRGFAKEPIVPPNPLLKRPIPAFLHAYSKASSTNIVLQWNLFSLSELESFDAMMTKLYRDENFDCVHLYENYRVLLTTLLESKPLVHRNHGNDECDEDNAVRLYS